MVGMLLNGQLKAPLWKQVTPLCNKLGITESKIIIAFMQVRDLKRSDNIFLVGIFLDFVGLATRAGSQTKSN